jgi:hypothetical protein
MPGSATSAAAVTNISNHGFWMLIDGRELFLHFEEFPWFKQASVEAILRLERPTPGHLHCRSLMSISRLTRSSTRAVPAHIKALRALHGFLRASRPRERSPLKAIAPAPPVPRHRRVAIPMAGLRVTRKVSATVRAIEPDSEGGDSDTRASPSRTNCYQLRAVTPSNETCG